MTYNGFYFRLFSRPMKRVLAEKYGPQYARGIMKKSKAVYRRLVEGADDLGKGNPMAYNALFALAFVAPYVASEKRLPPETVQEMMRRALYSVKWYFSRTDLNTEKGKAENNRASRNTSNGTRRNAKSNIPPRSRWISSASRTRARATIASPAAPSASTRKSWASRS